MCHLIPVGYLNLTMSYKVDSDIYFPFGLFQKAETPLERKEFSPDEAALSFRQHTMGQEYFRQTEWITTF